MGLFGSDKPDPQVQELVEQAKHDSVSIEVLSKKKASGLTSLNYLNDAPLIEYLKKEEQPHFIFPLLPYERNGVAVNGESVSPSDGLRTNVVISDRRILIAVGRRDGDKRTQIEYNDILDISIEQPDEEIYVLSIRTQKNTFEISRSNVDGDESVSEKIQLALEHISKNISDCNESAEDEGTDSREETDQQVQYEITANVNTYGIQVADEPASFSGDENDIFVDNYGIRINEQYEIRYENIATVERFDDRVEIANNDVLVIGQSEGVELVTQDGAHIGVFHHYSGEHPVPDLQFPTEVIEYLENKVNEDDDSTLPYEYSLSNPLTMERPDLKVEGWTDGSSSVDAEINASSSSKGKSKGIDLGPFIRSKTSSNSSIEGDISGNISDNTYTIDVLSFRLYDEFLSIDSKLNIELYYSDIDSVFKEDGGGMTKRNGTLVKPGDGIVIQTSSVTFRIEDLPEDAPIDEAIDFINSKMTSKGKNSSNVDDSDSKNGVDKLRDLKELYDEDVINKEEFESKKKEFLDDI